MSATTKTAEEIERLKQDWRLDPCWDIEDTAGFEAHAEELKAFRLERETEWNTQRRRREWLDHLHADKFVKIVTHRGCHFFRPSEMAGLWIQPNPYYDNVTGAGILHMRDSGNIELSREELGKVERLIADIGAMEIPMD